MITIISNIIDFSFKAGIIVGMILGSVITYFVTKL